MNWKEEIKKDPDEYTRESARIVKELGQLSMESSKRLSLLVDLAEKNGDADVIPMLLRVNEISKERNETMLKIIKFFEKREDLR